MDAKSKTESSTHTSVLHALTAEDKLVTTGMRQMAAPNKGKLQGIAGREPFDAIMGHVAPPDDTIYEPDALGGVRGWWCRPKSAPADSAILHLHGGWFSWGSALAFRNFVGHIAKRANLNAFVPDYRLAPENPFPAGLSDAKAAHSGMIERGIKKIALTGDSAGGGLALALLLATTGANAPLGAAVLSPVTDLTLSGDSWTTRAESDPYFLRPQVESLILSYLNGHEPTDPLASPLFGNLAGLPPILVHVGDDEVLLDDSVRFVEKASAAGVDARLETWLGMPHGFAGAVGQLNAAGHALDSIGSFLASRLA
jgi:acetyl esterase/lipase